MRNILICNEQLDIGGVETAVVTMCSGYLKKGYNVHVCANDGLYKNKLEKMGVKVKLLKYELLSRIPFDIVEDLKKYVIENNITEIHIHQYPCILYWLPVCLELKIPYVCFVHSIIPGTPQWFMKDFPIYKTVLPIFFTNASKIISIAKNTEDEIKSLFLLDDSKYKIVHNCLNMDEFKSNRKFKQIEKFALVSRLSQEKEKSIKKAIDFFKEYNKKNTKTKFYIAGDGDLKQELEKYANSKNIIFIGSTDNVKGFLEDKDIFIGLDRCILEAMAMKKVSIISSYDGNLRLIDKSNIKEASKGNFSGRNLTNDSKVIEKLNDLNQKKYNEIVSENYKFLDKEYNIDNHLYEDELVEIKDNLYIDVLKEANRLLDEIDNSKKNVLVEKISLKRRIKGKIKRILKKVGI